MKIYLVGIGGIGMSALAQLYRAEGHDVSGSDRASSPTTELLERKGIPVVLEQKAGNVPEDAELVVYSDAVWEDNPERVRAKELGMRQISYFEALGEVSKGRFTIAVTGTHGKTTTTAMLAKILKDAGKAPTAVIGSLVSEFGSNFVEGASGGPFVVEACEYRDHVLQLSPNILVLTNVEWDHTDWFPSLEALQETFGKAVAALPGDGVLVANPAGANVAPVLARASCRVVDYTKEAVPELQLIGEFNKMNARAAVAAARAAFPDISDTMIYHSVAEFSGTWRRFEYKGKTAEGALVYDDYAHHPTAVKETLAAVREKFPGKKLVVAFHPHLFTRTRDLMDEFADAFSAADEVLVAPIFPAREKPIPGVTAEALAEKIAARSGKPARGYASLADIESSLKAESHKLKAGGILITMGAGDIYKIASHLTSLQESV
ncbi:MAG: UDP-N-acetylmuramate--L-alanine ligase [Patescibacteria group bacterium]|nr:UDP-N-acetylmuramate--L-alanine ligase [Patescibacteria group bacterium]